MDGMTKMVGSMASSAPKATPKAAPQAQAGQVVTNPDCRLGMKKSGK